ncbi:hypothetical protein EL22_28960 [Halostagnicola sp. A56]|nr:hypothetical protein EL22_28960 [Halostagnicola sp. A56]
MTRSETKPDTLRITEPSEGFEIELDPEHLAQLTTIDDLDFVTDLLRYSPFGPTLEDELDASAED